MEQDKLMLNKGIQAEVVNAEALAVGDNAYAVKSISNTPPSEFLKLIIDFRKVIDELSLDRNARLVIEEDVKKLEDATKKEAINKEEVGGILQSISGKLKMVGVVMTETASLIEPIKKMASFLGTTAKLLGFLA